MVDQSAGPPRREFIRHPADILIQIDTAAGTPTLQHGHDVSFGGLAFASDSFLEPGSTVEVRIPDVRPVFKAHARVRWCRRDADQYMVGVEFLEHGAAFRIRMVEQICAIERYRREMQARDGKTPTSAEAAEEWISKYAAQFPNPDDAGTLE